MRLQILSVLAAGLLLAAIVWGGFVGSKRPSERPFFWIGFLLALGLIFWRAQVFEAPQADAKRICFDQTGTEIPCAHR